MKKPTNSATSLGEMVAAIEIELAAFDAWAKRGAVKGCLISCIEQHGGRATDRWDGARISFAGITVTCTAGLIQCARNWVRKARATMGEAA
jgi:hypothetical protein